MTDNVDSMGDVHAFQKAFDDAVEEYTKRTGVKIEHSKNETIESMRKEMARIDTGSTDRSVRQAARTGLDLLLKTGELVVGGVSSVWPPAAICFKATQILVETTQTYQQNFTRTGIRKSLDDTLFVLKDVQKYVDSMRRGAHMDDELKKVLLERLKHFLLMCAIYTKVSKESRTLIGGVKNGIKSLAGHVGEIQEHLEKIKELEERERKILSMDTWAVTKVMSSYMDLQSKDAITKERLLLIRKKLFLEGDNPALTSWLDKHAELRKDFIPNTGTWLAKNESFRHWENIRDTCSRCILALEGEPNSGKSSLCSEVIEKLHAKREGRSSTAGLVSHVSVAHFYFWGTSYSRGKEKPQTNLRDALASIVWQLANLDTMYQSFVAKVSESRLSHFATASEIWKHLILDFLESSRTQKIFFIVLDGISTEQAKDSELKRIIQQTAQPQQTSSQVRLLLSGTQKILHTLSPNAEETLETIHISEAISKDVKQVIERQIADLTTRHDSDKDKTELFKKLSDKLCAKYGRNFREAMSWLKEINKAQESMSKLREILEKETDMQWRIDKLQLEVLGDDEVSEINDIVVCMVLLNIWPSVKKLKAFLELGHESSQETSENKLEERIRRVCVHLFEVSNDDEETVSCTWDDMQYFRSLETSALNAGKEISGRKVANVIKKSNGANAPFHQSEVDTVQKIIRSVCGDEVFEKFRFNEYFETLRSPNAIGNAQTIQFHEIEGHMKITSRLLQAVCSTKREDCKCLHDYASTSMWDHLEKIHPDEHFGSSEEMRKSIGDYLLKFFTDKECVKIWLSNDRIENTAYYYMRLSQNWAHILGWVQQTVADENPTQQHSDIPPAENTNPESDNEKGESNQQTKRKEYTKDDLLATPMAELASKWLEDDACRASDAYHNFWLFSSQSMRAREYLKDYQSLPNEPEGIEKVEQWAIDALQIAEPSPLHHTRVAETFREYEHFAKSIERCEKLGATSQDWRARWCLAQAHESQGNHKPALTLLKQNLEQVYSPEFKKAHTAAWSDMVKKLLSLYDRTNSTDDATALSRNLWRKHTNDLQAKEIALERFKSSQTERDLQTHRKFLGSFQTSVELFHHSAKSPEFHDRVFIALKQDLGGLNKVYLDSIKFSQNPDERVYLRFYYGRALLHQHRLIEAVLRWEENIEDILDSRLYHADSRDSSTVQIYLKTAENLTEAYIQMLRNPRRGLSSSEELVSRAENVVEPAYVSIAVPYKLRLLLSRVYQLAERLGDAKENICGYVLDSLALLNDDTVDNDWEGYWRLCQVFVALGDEDNARAAWSLVTREGLYEDLVCQGDCGSAWKDLSDKTLYVCRDCADVHFDVECRNTLLGGQLGKPICGEDHCFMELPSLDTKAAEERIRKGAVKVGSAEKNISAWLGDIRRQYNPKELGRWRKMRAAVARRAQVWRYLF